MPTQELLESCQQMEKFKATVGAVIGVIIAFVCFILSIVYFIKPPRDTKKVTHTSNGRTTFREEEGENNGDITR